MRRAVQRDGRVVQEGGPMVHAEFAQRRSRGRSAGRQAGRKCPPKCPIGENAGMAREETHMCTRQRRR